MCEGLEKNPEQFGKKQFFPLSFSEDFFLFVSKKIGKIEFFLEKIKKSCIKYFLLE